MLKLIAATTLVVSSVAVTVPETDDAQVCVFTDMECATTPTECFTKTSDIKLQYLNLYVDDAADSAASLDYFKTHNPELSAEQMQEYVTLISSVADFKGGIPLVKSKVVQAACQPNTSILIREGIKGEERFSFYLAKTPVSTPIDAATCYPIPGTNNVLKGNKVYKDANCSADLSLVVSPYDVKDDFSYTIGTFEPCATVLASKVTNDIPGQICVSAENSLVVLGKVPCASVPYAEHEVCSDKPFVPLEGDFTTGLYNVAGRAPSIYLSLAETASSASSTMGVVAFVAAALVATRF